MKRLAASIPADAGQRQLLRQPVLQGREHPLRAAARLRRIGRDMLDAEPAKRPADLGQPRLVDRLAGLERDEIVAAAIRVEARRQAFGANVSGQPAKARGRAFLLDQEGRVDRAGRVVHGHDQVERRLMRQPFMPAAVLVQQHSLARLALALAPVRAAPPGPIHQPGRVQLRLDEGIAPAEMVVAHQMLVKMLHVPAKIAVTVKLQHLLDRLRRNPPRRNLAQTPVQQAGLPSLFVAVPVAAELPLRQAKQLARLHHRQIAALPAAQNVPKLLHSPVL